MDFKHRDPEYKSVIVLCQRVQSSPDACPYMEDLNKLLDCSESFKTRWTGIERKCHMTRSLLEKRVAIYEAWYHDVRTLSEWVDEKNMITGNLLKMDGSSSSSMRISSMVRIISESPFFFQFFFFRCNKVTSKFSLKSLVWTLENLNVFVTPTKEISKT